MSTSTESKTKRRSDMACTSCRRRKLKCENKDSTPPCKRCDHDKADCQFVPVSEDSRTDRNSKTPSGSRGSSEDCKSNHQPNASPPAQMTPAPPRRVDRHTNSGTIVSSQTPFTSPPYFPSGRSIRPDPSGYNDVPNHPYEDPHSIPEPQVHWPDTQTYTPSSGRYGNHIPPTPPYIYSPPPNPPYSQPLYDHPRAAPYYNNFSTPHVPQAAPHYHYYPASQQPSGLVAYPDPNTPNGPPCDNSHFCGSFPH